MNKRLFIYYTTFLLCLFLICKPSFSQEDSVINYREEANADNLINKDAIDGFWDTSPVKPVKDIAITGINDAWALLKSPVQWDSTSWLLFPSIALGAYFLMIVDEPITHELLGDKKYAHSDFVKWSEFYGRTITTQYSAAGFTVLGIALGEKKLVKIGLEIYESYFFANNIHSIFKRAFGRSRPVEEKGVHSFDPFPERKNPLNSFPSGHATLAFSLSTVLAKNVDNIFLKILAYTPAVLTCFSRVYQNYHWTSDVFLGGVIGYLVGDFIVKRHNVEGQNFFSIGFDEMGRVSLVFPL